MIMDSFYSEEELSTCGLKRYGDHVKVSRKCSLYYAEEIQIGNNVRIDDFCILSGKITIEDYVHISAGVYLFGGEAGITFQHHSSISSQSVVYAVSDDYSGEYLTNSTVESEYRHVINAPVVIGAYSVIGAGTIILPGIVLGEGCGVGAASLVTKNLKEWMIYKGTPAKVYKKRSRKLLEYLDKERKIMCVGGAQINNIFSVCVSVKRGDAA